MSDYVYETLRVETRDAMAVITLNRPKMMNTLNHKMKQELADVFSALTADNSVLGVILTSEGRAFCAGTDVSQGQEGACANPLVMLRDSVDQTHQLFEQIEAFQRPVIAAVNGYALGGGTELCLVCDLRIASSEAVFGLPEVNLGVLPCYGGTQRLPRLIGTGRAKDLLMTGRKVRAAEAEHMGLVNQVVEPGELMAAAEAKLQEIITKAPIAVKMCKLAVNKGMEQPLHYALELEKDMVAICSGTKDAVEGGTAFMEKRAPKFQNA